MHHFCYQFQDMFQAHRLLNEIHMKDRNHGLCSAWTPEWYNDTARICVYVRHISYSLTAVFNSSIGWDGKSACKGASGCPYQSIFDLTHPLNDLNNPCMKCLIKPVIDHQELRPLLFSTSVGSLPYVACEQAHLLSLREPAEPAGRMGRGKVFPPPAPSPSRVPFASSDKWACSHAIPYVPCYHVTLKMQETGSTLHRSFRDRFHVTSSYSQIQNYRVTKGFIPIRHKTGTKFISVYNYLLNSVFRFETSVFRISALRLRCAWHEAIKIAFAKNYALNSWFLPILGVKVLGKVLG